jgi:hypothetical protein
MVMHNRNEGSDAPHWWDDLPPKVRDRFRQPIAHDEEAGAAAPAVRPADPAPLPSRGELVGDLSRLAAVFVLIAVAILFYMIVAVTYVNG